VDQLVGAERLSPPEEPCAELGLLVGRKLGERAFEVAVDQLGKRVPFAVPVRREHAAFESASTCRAQSLASVFRSNVRCLFG
jgi:hypothetical protein